MNMDEKRKRSNRTNLISVPLGESVAANIEYALESTLSVF